MAFQLLAAVSAASLFRSWLPKCADEMLRAVSDAVHQPLAMKIADAATVGEQPPDDLQDHGARTRRIREARGDGRQAVSLPARGERSRHACGEFRLSLRAMRVRSIR